MIHATAMPAGPACHHIQKYRVTVESLSDRFKKLPLTFCEKVETIHHFIAFGILRIRIWPKARPRRFRSIVSCNKVS